MGVSVTVELLERFDMKILASATFYCATSPFVQIGLIKNIYIIYKSLYITSYNRILCGPNIGQ